MISEIAAGLAILLVSATTIATVWSRRETWVRSAAVVAFGLLFPLLIATSYYAKSWPLPLNEWTAPAGKVRVISAHMRQDISIDLWLSTKDGPRYYYLPWSNEMANRLQGMMDAEAEDGRGFFMFMDKSHDEAKFDRVQILPSPPKVDQDTAPNFPTHQ